MPTLSIVVALYNQLQYTQLFLKSIRDNTRESHEIIVVDNGSTDATKQWIRTQHVDKLISWDRNLGTTKAWNAGIRASRGEYICLINNDMVVGPGWIKGLLQVLNNPPPDLAALSPSTNGVTYDLEVTPDQRGVQRFEAEAGRLETATPSLWPYSLIGSCIVLPRKTIDKVGLFDERYFAYYNDLDYSLTLTSLGMKAYTTSLSTVYHFGGKSAGTDRYIAAMKENDKRAFLSKWRQTRSFLNDYFNTLE